MSADQIVALISLVLSIFFWWNARQQAASAERTLQEIKSQIIGWQNELNKTAVEMLSARPEMIAMRTALADAGADSGFTTKMAQLVERLSTSVDPNKTELVKVLLAHHERIVLERQRIGMNAAAGRIDTASAG